MGIEVPDSVGMGAKNASIPIKLNKINFPPPTDFFCFAFNTSSSTLFNWDVSTHESPFAIEFLIESVDHINFVHNTSTWIEVHFPKLQSVISSAQLDMATRQSIFASSSI